MEKSNAFLDWIAIYGNPVIPEGVLEATTPAIAKCHGFCHVINQINARGK